MRYYTHNALFPLDRENRDLNLLYKKKRFTPVLILCGNAVVWIIILKAFLRFLTPSLLRPVKIRAEKCMAVPQKQHIFRSYNTSTVSAMYFDENPFTCQCEKEKEKAEGFQISHFYWSFSSDIMAVKGFCLLLLLFCCCCCCCC